MHALLHHKQPVSVLTGQNQQTGLKRRALLSACFSCSMFAGCSRRRSEGAQRRRSQEPRSRRLVLGLSLLVSHRLLSKNRGTGALREASTERRPCRTPSRVPSFSFTYFGELTILGFAVAPHLYSGVSVDSSTGACLCMNDHRLLFFSVPFWRNVNFFTFYIVARRRFCTL